MNDPYRYRCPDCGSTRLRRRSTFGAVPSGGGPEADAPFYCRTCNTGHSRRRDARTGDLVS